MPIFKTNCKQNTGLAITITANQPYQYFFKTPNMRMQKIFCISSISDFNKRIIQTLK